MVSQERSVSRYPLRKIIYLLVVIGTAGFSFYEYKQSQTEEQLKHKQELVFPSLKASQIQSVQIIKNKKIIHFFRHNKKWRLKSPVKDKANNSTITDWIQGLLSAKVKIIKNKKGDWSEYGLTKKVTSVILTTKKNKQFVLDISYYSAFDGSIYLKKNDILLLGTTAFAQLSNKPTHYFKSYKILNNFETPIKLNYKSKSFIADLNWEDYKWKWNKKNRFPINQSFLHTYKTQINNMEFQKKTYPKTKQNLKKFKLLNPDIKLNLEFKKDKWFIKISRSVKQKFYALISTRDYIVALNKKQRDQIFLNIKKIRDHRKPFSFITDNAYFIEIKRKGLDIILKKENQQWVVSKNKNKTKKINIHKIPNVLNKINRLLAHKYVGSKSFIKPSYLIIKNKDKKNILELKFSVPFYTKSPKVYVQSSAGQEIMVLNLKDIESVFSGLLLKDTKNKKNTKNKK